MRGKRSKQYRKLMKQYGLSFGFREPFQVLVDAEIVRDADNFKMDLIGGLERTLQGKVKPMITQCSMRHLYAAAKEPGVSYLIDKAKTYERRRCNHLPEEYPEPLSTKECLASVIDPKEIKMNKHRYVVASQDLEARKEMRGIMGVPLIYINRSVMIMEPMASASAETRDRGERSKFRDGIKGKERGSGSLKRAREQDEEGLDGETPKKKAKRKGPKGPNPLSVKKPKRKSTNTDGSVLSSRKEKQDTEAGTATQSQLKADESESGVKRKRKRKYKSAVDNGESTPVPEATNGDK